MHFIFSKSGGPDDPVTGPAGTLSKKVVDHKIIDSQGQRKILDISDLISMGKIRTLKTKGCATLYEGVGSVKRHL